MHGSSRNLGLRRVALMSIVFTGLVMAWGAQAQTPDVTYAKQGWTDDDRSVFYTTVQGSHIMPYAWFKALRQAGSDTPFMADQLSRYGYIRNDSPTNTEGLPIGFVIDGTPAQG